VPEPEAVPAAVVSTQTFGDYPERFHPHLHVLATDGCSYREGLFFRVKVLAMLLRKKKISPELIRMLGKSRGPLPSSHSLRTW
jgi:hypothetical protein